MATGARSHPSPAGGNSIHPATAATTTIATSPGHGLNLRLRAASTAAATDKPAATMRLGTATASARPGWCSIQAIIPPHTPMIRANMAARRSLSMARFRCGPTVGAGRWAASRTDVVMRRSLY